MGEIVSGDGDVTEGGGLTLGCPAPCSLCLRCVVLTLACLSLLGACCWVGLVEIKGDG